ncbi:MULTISPECIES: tRNA uracil 4-sulfurtransferase ThiI [unclassified Wenzhouxiangella]|uniref:tRNA uracil 4-sulfurtransferase ThiI n=1 Tax=unclassified Wenzhouxiangella TaxID=2613841 RepID=UPI000E3255FB|nr:MULTISPECIES: tRNA uracil 4-sulfurtransferase ThiI [unclassified Wenzhouxiangella]RFF26691.1 tRNA 4-thiouridine(8) synthase ThiI [Wenzhouxiangella sp. 15181]RFP69339.1 tRNA 4-thiouridine(8) synthase ThiI [Wenzhouxiangella sp. 15190]
MSTRPTLKPLLSLSISGEVSTKSSHTRRRFHRKLRSNLKAALEGKGHTPRLIDSRDRIDLHDLPASAAPLLARVFGVQSVRTAHSLDWDSLDDIIEAGTGLFAGEVDGRRFAVRPRRVGNSRHPRRISDDIARQLGTKLVEAGGRVNLDNPEVAVHVEIRNDDALLFGNPLPGPGGLPLGTEGRALTLISGGFDSAVAAWQMLQRGLDMDFVLFDLAGPEQVAGVQRVLTELDKRWMAGSRARFFVVDFRPVVAELRSQTRGDYWQVMIKRLMMRAAGRLAEHTKAGALVTGEALGQVSSQTLANLGAIGARTELPIIRPLVGLNKEDILKRAHEIGTFEASSGNAEFCALDGGRPVTSARASALDRFEEHIDTDLIERLVDEAEVIERAHFATPRRDEASLDHVPDDTAVIDLRGEQAHADWHWPDSIQLDFDRACRFAGALPKDRDYLLVCEFGLKSAWLAEAMRREGYRAWSFRGGIRRLQKLAAVAQ